MDTKEELKKIKKNEMREKKAKMDKERADENEWAKHVREEFGSIIIKYFQKENIASCYFEIHDGLFRGLYVPYLYRNSVSSKFLEIEKELIFHQRLQDTFGENMKKYLENQGIRIKFGHIHSACIKRIWLEVI